MKKEHKEYYAEHPYTIVEATDGKKYVNWESVWNDTLNMSNGNEKVGKVTCLNFPVFYTCNHQCECYKQGKCYALGGCYNFMSNQATYSENYAFYRTHTQEEFTAELVKQFTEYKNNLARYFTCGDIIDTHFLLAMIETARQLPEKRFWSYTKKYSIVNHYCDVYGVESIPENLVIIFSHWLNEDGTYFPMDNPYDFPTSEFIPVGKEHLVEKMTHICPCSDPNSLEHCDTCEHPCYLLKHGESMALLEHSTKETRERDKALKEAKNALCKTTA